MSRVYLVRHGRAAAGWNTDPDPGLDELGRMQAQRVAEQLRELGPLPILASPLRRCQETAVPLAAAWGSAPIVDEAVREIPSPEGIPMEDRVEWLRRAMAGGWEDLGDRYTAFRDGVAARLLALDTDAVVFSHFVAINAAIGAATGDDRVVIRRLDNGSVTVIDAVGGVLRLLAGGHEADTLIR